MTKAINEAKSTTEDDSHSEQEARIALLQHYSSKSSMQVTNILTVALGFFAFVTSIGTLNNFLNSYTVIFSELVLGLFVALVVHSGFRLLYWGGLADKAISSDFSSPQRLSDSEKRFQRDWADALGKLEQKYSDQKTILNKFQERNFKAGCPKRRDYTLASYNMQRLTEGIGKQTIRKNVHSQIQFLRNSGKTDPALFAISVWVLVAGCLNLIFYPFSSIFNVIFIIAGGAMLSVWSIWIFQGLRYQKNYALTLFYGDRSIGCCPPRSVCAEQSCQYSKKCNRTSENKALVNACARETDIKESLEP